MLYHSNTLLYFLLYSLLLLAFFLIVHKKPVPNGPACMYFYSFYFVFLLINFALYLEYTIVCSLYKL
jgi:hypothetical protein